MSTPLVSSVLRTNTTNNSQARLYAVKGTISSKPTLNFYTSNATLTAGAANEWQRFTYCSLTCSRAIRYSMAWRTLPGGVAASLQFIRVKTNSVLLTRASSAGTTEVVVGQLPANEELLVVLTATAQVLNPDNLVFAIFTELAPESSGETIYTPVNTSLVTSPSVEEQCFMGDSFSVDPVSGKIITNFTDQYFDAANYYLIGWANENATVAAYTRITLSNTSPIFNNETTIIQSFPIGGRILYAIKPTLNGFFTGSMTCETVQVSGTPPGTYTQCQTCLTYTNI